MFRICSLFLCYLSSFLTTHAQVVFVTFRDYVPPGYETDDTVYYAHEHPLTWDDFTGKVNKESPSSAVSFSSFSYDGSGLLKNDTLRVQLTIQVYFVKSGSWVRPGQADSYSLAHEQTHFDIAKLSAERFRRKVEETRLSPDYYDSEISFIYWDVYREMNTLQEQYDKETRHGGDRAAQYRWQEKVKRMLRPLPEPEY